MRRLLDRVLGPLLGRLYARMTWPEYPNWRSGAPWQDRRPRL